MMRDSYSMSLYAADRHAELFAESEHDRLVALASEYEARTRAANRAPEPEPRDVHFWYYALRGLRYGALLAGFRW